MEKYVVCTVVSVIAGIILFIVILINNTDKETKKPSNEWWIPSSGFLLSCAVLLPTFLFIDDSVYPTQSSVIMWLLFAILGISVITWITGKLIRRKKGKL
jgi:cytochrome bd-type quinol oxidase subunit 2